MLPLHGILIIAGSAVVAIYAMHKLRQSYGRPTYAEIKYGGRRTGDWDRHHGKTVVVVHPESDWGKSRKSAEENGWVYLGRTRMGIVNPEHPGLDVYEDRTLYARWLRFRGKAKDDFQERGLRCVGGKTWA